MMNKTIAIIITLLWWHVGVSQSSYGGNSINHAKGIKTISLMYGGTKYSPFRYAKAEFGYFFQDNLVMRSGLNWDKGEVGQTNYWDLKVNAGIGGSIYDIGNKFYINLYGGAQCGLERTFNRPYQQKDFHFVYGGFAAAEMEYFIGNFGIVGEFQEYLTLGSPFGNLHWSLSFGLKYNIY